MPASSRFSSTLPEHQQRQNASGDYQRSAGLKIRCDTKLGTNLGQTLIGLLIERGGKGPSSSGASCYAIGGTMRGMPDRPSSKIIGRDARQRCARYPLEGYRFLSSRVPILDCSFIEFENRRRIIFKWSINVRHHGSEFSKLDRSRLAASAWIARLETFP